jgi:hypothetical protein
MVGSTHTHPTMFPIYTTTMFTLLAGIVVVVSSLSSETATIKVSVRRAPSSGHIVLHRAISDTPTCDTTRPTPTHTAIHPLGRTKGSLKSTLDFPPKWPSKEPYLWMAGSTLEVRARLLCLLFPAILYTPRAAKLILVYRHTHRFGAQIPSPPSSALHTFRHILSSLHFPRR